LLQSQGDKLAEVPLFLWDRIPTNLLFPHSWTGDMCLRGFVPFLCRAPWEFNFIMVSLAKEYSVTAYFMKWFLLLSCSLSNKEFKRNELVCLRNPPCVGNTLS
jgi:hypothetical protein